MSTYVDAFPEDFKTIIIEINDEINFNDQKNSKSQKNTNGSSRKLSTAISLHYEMLKYLS